MTDEGVFAPTRISQWTKNGVNFLKSGMTNVMSAPPGGPLDAVPIIWLDDITEIDGARRLNCYFRQSLSPRK